jgi:hypothetical protein
MSKRFFRIQFIGLLPYFIYIIINNIYLTIINFNVLGLSRLIDIILSLGLIGLLFSLHFIVYKRWCIKHLFNIRC